MTSFIKPAVIWGLVRPESLINSHVKITEARLMACTEDNTCFIKLRFGTSIHPIHFLNSLSNL